MKHMQYMTSQIGEGAFPLVSLKNISKVYFPGTDSAYEALRDVSLEIRQGEFVSLVGASGCGKSTLLRIIAGQEQPSGGDYRFAGVSLAQYSAKERSKLRRGKLALISQHYDLLWDQSALENVLRAMRADGLSAAQKRHRAEQLLRFVGLEHRASAAPDQLSGGQQQRLAIARALTGRPTLLLADEPTAALDMENKELIFHLLEKLNRSGVTVVLITHDLSLAFRTRRMITLQDGTVFADRVLSRAG